MIRYLKKIIESSSKESSKRFGFLWILAIITIVSGAMVYYKMDLIWLMGTLIGFAGALVGISTYESIKKNRDEQGKPKE